MAVVYELLATHPCWPRLAFGSALEAGEYLSILERVDRIRVTERQWIYEQACFFFMAILSASWPLTNGLPIKKMFGGWMGLWAGPARNLLCALTLAA